VANFKSIAAAGKTIERVLNACFAADQPLGNAYPTKAVLVRSADFDQTGGVGDAIPTRALSIFLYRVDVNKVMRSAWAAVGSFDGQAHLPIDLHYLLTPWADNAEHEQQILGKAMQCLDSRPSLSGPLLYPTAEWSANEALHVYVEELGLDTIMRTFDSLEIGFKISVPYLARIVRLDGRDVAPPPAPATVITGLTPTVVA
jgi:hypothetical protein